MTELLALTDTMPTNINGIQLTLSSILWPLYNITDASTSKRNKAAAYPTANRVGATGGPQFGGNR